MPESQRILKANDLRGLGTRIVFNYEDINQRCQEQVTNAQAEADTILEKAKHEADVIKQQAFDEGRTKGYEAGSQDAQTEIERRAADLAEQAANKKLETTLPAMIEAADALALERDRWLTEWEAAGVRLSVAIAEKVIGHELAAQPELSNELVARALELAAGNPQVKLRLHSEDAKLLGAHAEEVIKTMARCSEAQITPDDKISRGGCLVETQHGAIDARIETQLQRIASELLPSSAK